MLQDGLSVLVESARLMQKAEPSQFNAVVLGSAVFAVFAWWTALYYPKLWNRRFVASGAHHAVCFLAAVLTVAFSVSFAALGYAPAAATVRIGAWRDEIVKDEKMHNQAAIRVYHAVKDSGLETFGREHAVSETGAFYPVSRPETQRLTATTYAAIALEKFETAHPDIYRAVWRKSTATHDRIIEDRQVWDTTKRYPLARYFYLASEEVQSQLEMQTERMVYNGRRGLAALFLCAQALTFLSTGLTSLRRR